MGSEMCIRDRYWCGAGLVRIIWGTTANGSARTFPNTNIGDIV